MQITLFLLHDDLTRSLSAFCAPHRHLLQLHHDDGGVVGGADGRRAQLPSPDGGDARDAALGKEVSSSRSMGHNWFWNNSEIETGTRDAWKHW